MSMHKTEKQKINLIYNHNFQEKFDFLLCRKRNGNQNYTKSFKGELQAKMQDSTLHYCQERVIQSYLPYSNQFRQVLGKIINPM